MYFSLDGITKMSFHNENEIYFEFSDSKFNLSEGRKSNLT